MSDDFATPVKGIIKAYDSGIKLARRIAKSANSTTALKALDIATSARDLQESLEGSSKAVADVYTRCFEQWGEPFARALMEDSELILFQD